MGEGALGGDVEDAGGEGGVVLAEDLFDLRRSRRRTCPPRPRCRRRACCRTAPPGWSSRAAPRPASPRRLWRYNASPVRPETLEVARDEQGVVVEHLLEVRHEPAGVGAVAGEAAAEVVVDAAARHGVERVGATSAGRARRRSVLAGASRSSSQDRRVGETWGAEPKPAVRGSKAGRQGVGRRRAVAAPDPALGRRLGGPSRRLGDLGARSGQASASRRGLAWSRSPRPLRARRRATWPSSWWTATIAGEVGAAEEGPAVAGQEDGHRPAAAAGDRLDGAPCRLRLRRDVPRGRP